MASTDEMVEVLQQIKSNTDDLSYVYDALKELRALNEKATKIIKLMESIENELINQSS